MPVTKKKCSPKYGKDYSRTVYAHEAGTHVLTFPLVSTKHDEHVLYKRFGIIGHSHNVMARHANRLLDKLDSNGEYNALLKQYAELKETLPEDEFGRKSKPVCKRMNAIRCGIGLSEAGFHAYIKTQSRMFAKHISSQQMQKEASRVWEGVCSILFGEGKRLHLKPYREITTICGKSPRNGVQFFAAYHDEAAGADTVFHNCCNDKVEIRYPDGQIHWNGLIIRVKIDYDDPYIVGSLQHNIKYCEIKRMMFPSGWRYYVSLYLEGPAPKKIVSGDADLCEIDPGVSTMAVYSENKLILRELAPDARGYQKQILRLQRQIDGCRRRLNPKNYRPDGTVKRGRHKWLLSKAAKRKQRMVTVLHRKEAASRKCSHCRLANDIVRISPHIRLEPMDYRALQKRSKKQIEKTDRIVTVKTKSGETKTVHKNKRKKRFGTSCRTRAPAMFLGILEAKALKYGGSVAYIDTRTVKPSQYDHVSDEFVKTDLRQRSKVIGVHIVQRDLYSAFIGYCVKPDGKTFDRDKANALFDRFVIAQDKELSLMKAQGISMPQCFGF